MSEKNKFLPHKEKRRRIVMMSDLSTYLSREVEAMPPGSRKTSITDGFKRTFQGVKKIFGNMSSIPTHERYSNHTEVITRKKMLGLSRSNMSPVPNFRTGKRKSLSDGDLYRKVSFDEEDDTISGFHDTIRHDTMHFYDTTDSYSSCCSLNSDGRFHHVNPSEHCCIHGNDVTCNDLMCDDITCLELPEIELNNDSLHEIVTDAYTELSDRAQHEAEVVPNKQCLKLSKAVRDVIIKLTKNSKKVLVSTTCVEKNISTEVSVGCQKESGDEMLQVQVFEEGKYSFWVTVFLLPI